MYQIETRIEPPRLVLARAHLGPYAEMGGAFGRLMDLVAEHGLARLRQELVGVFHDDPDAVPPAALRSHAGITVPEATFCPPGLEAVTLAGGRHAVLRLAGPYTGLYPAYRWLYGEGLAAAGLTLTSAPSFEVYFNDPSTVAIEDLLTEIHIPVE